QLLVLGNGFGNRAGVVGFSGPDFALASTVAELNKILLADSANRDFPLLSSLYYRSGARSQANFVGQRTQFRQLAFNVELLAVQGGAQELPPRLQARMRQLFLLVFDNHAIETSGLVDSTSPAEANVRATQTLQLDGDVLQDMGRIGAAVQPLEKAAHLAHAA